MEELDDLLQDTLSRHGLSLESLRCIATAELKQDEAGIVELARTYDVPLQCYNAEELNAVFGSPARSVSTLTAAEPAPTPSETAHRLVGVWGVAEPAAMLAAGSASLVVPRQQIPRATVAVARVPFEA